MVYSRVSVSIIFCQIYTLTTYVLPSWTMLFVYCWIRIKSSTVVLWIIYSVFCKIKKKLSQDIFKLDIAQSYYALEYLKHYFKASSQNSISLVLWYSKYFRMGEYPTQLCFFFIIKIRSARRYGTKQQQQNTHSYKTSAGYNIFKQQVWTTKHLIVWK